MLASAVSCLLVSAAHAAIEKPNGWYVEGSWEDMAAAKKYPNLSIAGLSLGYKKDFLRGEAQVGYARIKEKLCGFTSCTIDRTSNAFNLGVHGFLDWDNSTMISPYVGLGAEKSTWAPAYEGYRRHYTKSVKAVGLVGARAYFTSNLALDVGYKTNLAHVNEGGVGSLGLAWHFD